MIERQRRIVAATIQAMSYFDDFPDDTVPIPIVFGDGDVVRVDADGMATYFTKDEYEAEVRRRRGPTGVKMKRCRDCPRDPRITCPWCGGSGEVPAAEKPLIGLRAFFDRQR